MRLAKQRDEEARLAGIVAKTKAQELDAQQQQAIAHTRQRAEQASRAAKEEIAAREELSAAEHAAALERAAARTAMDRRRTRRCERGGVNAPGGSSNQLPVP